MINELLEFVDEEVEMLGSRNEIEHIYTIMERGTSADEQVKVYDETDHDLKAVVDRLILNTMENVPTDCFG